jgi:hypothetical protein
MLTSHEPMERRIPRASRRRILASLGGLAAAAVLPSATALADTTPPSTAPAQFNGTVQGALQGRSGGSFAFYQVSTPGDTPLRITLRYLPYTAPTAHQVGFEVFQGGKLLASAHGMATGVGDDHGDNAPSVVVTPRSDAGPVLVKVFVYSSDIVIYTLSALPVSVTGAVLAARVPGELADSQGGMLTSDSGGATAAYMISQPTGQPVALDLVYGPYDAGYAHRVGLTVYQDGKKLGTATSLATGLGDDVNRNNARLTVTPSIAGGPVLILVFSFSRYDITYTLLSS